MSKSGILLYVHNLCVLIAAQNMDRHYHRTMGMKADNLLFIFYRPFLLFLIATGAFLNVK